MMDVTVRECSAEAESPRRRDRSAPRDTDDPPTPRVLLLRECSVDAASPRRRASIAARDADDPPMPRALRESSVDAASPRRRARSAPRDADDPATTRDKERGGRGHAPGPSAPRFGRPVLELDRQRDSSTRSVREAELEPGPLQKKAKSAQLEAGKPSAPRVGSPVPWFHPQRCSNRHLQFSTDRDIGPVCSCGKDLWTEVAKHISGSDLIRLSGTCRWLFDLLADDSIWHYAFFRELQLLSNDSFAHAFFYDLHPLAIDPHSSHHPNFYWRRLYFANELHAFFDWNNELGESGFGGFIMDSSDLLLTARLPTPMLSLRHSVESMGTCILTNARHGVWIIDMQVIKCLGCGIADCEGTIQVLEARHCELLLEVDRECLQLEELGRYLVNKEVSNAFCGIFNCEHLNSPSTASVISISSWTGDHKYLLTRSRRSLYGGAINTNLQANRGLLSMFEELREDKEGHIVCVRIQQILH